jgi:hypothetical protein
VGILLSRIRGIVVSHPWRFIAGLEVVLAIAFLALAYHVAVRPARSGAVPPTPVVAPAGEPAQTQPAARPSVSPSPGLNTPSPGSASAQPPSASFPPGLLDRLNRDGASRYREESGIVRAVTRALKRYLVDRVLPDINARREGGPR